MTTTAIGRSFATTSPDSGLSKNHVSRPSLMAVASRVSNVSFLHDVGMGVRFLVDTFSFANSSGHDIVCLILPTSACAPTDEYAHLLTSYSEVFRPEFHQTTTAPAKHCIYPHTKTTKPPVFTKCRRLAPDRLAAAKQTLAKNEEMGLCHKDSSPWSSPLQIVLKTNGSMWELEVSEHANRTGSLPTTKHHQRDLLPVQSKGFLHARPLEGLLSGAYEPSRHPQDISRTTALETTAPRTVTPRQLPPGQGTPPSPAHRAQPPATKWLVVRYDKCTFGANEVSFLAISASFAPLHASLKGEPKDLKWGALQEAAFCNAKNALSTAAALTFPVPHAPFLISTVASDVTIGAALKQVVNGLPCLLAFFSWKLTKGESGFSNFDSELLAVHLAVHHFYHFLDGTPFIIHTDRMVLVHAFT
ncbi:uncharacterized protein [Palaemon carinicauda]|uniref:uncharacterized protein n=1 Tax=Palaemon carinicauda TaxID=392227 RepID=UPI0035B64456